MYLGLLFVTEEHISKAELRLTDIAEAVQKDWIQLAAQLGVRPTEVDDIQADFDADVERALVMLHLWVQSSDRRATGNDLEMALDVIGRADVIRRCMYNVKEVTDVNEKAVAKGYLDKSTSHHDDSVETLGTCAHSSFILDFYFFFFYAFRIAIVVE